jgi:CBS domain containing-hemolysin-like protein
VTLSATKLLRPVLFVPPSMPATDLLVRRCRRPACRSRFVIDEYGGTDGLVSLEDLVEIGRRRHRGRARSSTTTRRPSRRPARTAFIADARVDARGELQAATGIGLSTPPRSSEEVDTHRRPGRSPLAGRDPGARRADLAAGAESLEFEVLDADPRRVKRLRIHRRDPVAAEPPATPDAA